MKIRISTTVTVRSSQDQALTIATGWWAPLRARNAIVDAWSNGLWERWWRWLASEPGSRGGKLSEFAPSSGIEKRKGNVARRDGCREELRAAQESLAKVP